MSDSDEFIDYYEILQVSPNCDIKIIESSYRHFAKIYHPDHGETADPSRFTAVVDAYNILKFPKKRQHYNIIYNSRKENEIFVEKLSINSETAIDDAKMQIDFLLYLYNRKRDNFKELGVPPYYIQEHFGCTDNIFNFHIWYLRSKGYLETTEEGTLSITVLGVDHVISIHQPKHPEKLLTDRTGDTVD